MMPTDALVIYTVWTGTSDGHGGTDYDDDPESFDVLDEAMAAARAALAKGRCVLIEPEIVARAEWASWPAREALCQT